MQTLLVRESGADRFFPQISSDLYSMNRHAGPSESRTGAKLLALSDSLPLTWWQRLAGWRLAPDQRVARLLLLHRLAFEAEMEGQFRRADFFWREALAQLGRVWTHT